MFCNCTNLTSIASSNPGENPSTNMTSTSASENIGNLDFSNFRTAKVQNFSYMFFACKALRYIKGLDNWNTTAATNMSFMFAYDDNLNSLDLSKFNTSQVTTFEAMFVGCEKLTSITGLNNWDTTAATAMSSMSSMFAYDSSLQKLDLSSFDTRNATQYNFFLGDNKLWYLKIGKYTQLKDDCGLPEAPKDTLFPSEFPNKPENPKNPEYKTSQNGKWQKVIKKEEDDYWWQPNDDIYTNDEVIKDSQSNDNKLFIWQPAFSQTTKGSLVLNVSPSQINFDIILDTNNNILGNNNKSSYSAEANSDLEYTVQNPQGESWQLYAMMTKFKKKSNSDSEINSGAMSLSLNEGSENGKQHPLNQQPTSIRTSADNSLEWALKPVLDINISGLNGIPKAGSSYTTTIDYDLVNSIQ